MAHKYLVDLTVEEQGYLYDVIRKGKTTARRVARAHVLLQAATGAADAEIAATLHSPLQLQMMWSQNRADCSPLQLGGTNPT